MPQLVVGNPGQEISGNPWPDSADKVEITFKNRHAPGFTPALITRLTDSEYLVESRDKIQGIAPGQREVKRS